MAQRRPPLRADRQRAAANRNIRTKQDIPDHVQVHPASQRYRSNPMIRVAERGPSGTLAERSHPGDDASQPSLRAGNPGQIGDMQPGDRDHPGRKVTPRTQGPKALFLPDDPKRPHAPNPANITSGSNPKNQTRYRTGSNWCHRRPPLRAEGNAQRAHKEHPDRIPDSPSMLDHPDLTGPKAFFHPHHPNEPHEPPRPKQTKHALEGPRTAHAVRAPARPSGQMAGA